mmetsp:Transcript_27245/g.78375  ORF Transcript_27245/g.78375 Transcript_27245/m.78375 type:complete len:239 (+) Transcript_27245:440-1156(+)
MGAFRRRRADGDVAVGASHRPPVGGDHDWSLSIELDKKVDRDISRLKAAGKTMMDKRAVTESTLQNVIKRVEKEFINEVQTLAALPVIPIDRFLHLEDRTDDTSEEKAGPTPAKWEDTQPAEHHKRVEFVSFQEAVSELKKFERSLKRAHDGKSTACQGSLSTGLSKMFDYLDKYCHFSMWPALLKKETELYKLITLRLKPGNKTLVPTCNVLLGRLKDAEKVIETPHTPLQNKTDRV